MRARRRVVACAWMGLLLLNACGRLGFDLLSGDDENPGLGNQDAGLDGGGQPSDGGMTGMDAGVDGGPGPGPDSGSPPGPEAGMDARVQIDAGDAGDASDDEDGGFTQPGCTLTSVADYCAELPRLSEPPTIDGELECGLTLRPFTPVDWTAATPIPADHSARIAAGWLPDGVYVFIDVDDTTRLPRLDGLGSWCGDGVEVYVDDDSTYAMQRNYDNPGTIQTLALAPADDTNSVSIGERYRSTGGGLVGPWTSANFVAVPRPGGYVFEAFIAAADLDLTSWTLASGASVGFDLAVNVSVSADPPPAGETADCGRRMGQYFLRIAETPCGPSCHPYVNSSAFCAPVLRD